MSIIIEGKDIVKTYGDFTKFTAIKGISVTINEKDFICIMGPSGSGKSTLVNILATIDKPTTGKVLIEGENVKALREDQISKFRKETISFIFQDFNLLDTLTLRENIMVPLTLLNIDNKECIRRIDEVALRLGIDDLLDKFPAECSGGQIQRAAACRALVTKPKLIIADEPTGNLDTKSSHELLTILQELNEKDGIAVLMVTHDNMIASYSKKLLFIRDGLIEDVKERGELTQKQFFYKIVEITSRESQSMFKDMGNDEEIAVDDMDYLEQIKMLKEELKKKEEQLLEIKNVMKN